MHELALANQRRGKKEEMTTCLGIHSNNSHSCFRALKVSLGRPMRYPSIFQDPSVIKLTLNGCVVR